RHHCFPSAAIVGGAFAPPRGSRSPPKGAHPVCRRGCGGSVLFFTAWVKRYSFDPSASVPSPFKAAAGKARKKPPGKTRR
ncbi:MAG: hypothetical protein J6S75_11380, partial [Thermoguttaceae bacterium]|nr:hypothetical protein [Thermoguttaceae bacterium]